MAFAITGGTFSDPAIWDTGIVPTGSENAYANGYTIQISGTVNCGAVRNDASDYRFIDTAIPLMTSNTSPSGEVLASSSSVGGEAYRAFDRNSSTAWITPSFVSTGTLTYNFISTRIIKRYMFRVLLAAQAPRSWTFLASNDVNFGAGNVETLDTQTNATPASGGLYTSGLINTGNTAYQYYRINVTAIGSTWPLTIAEVEMTESTSTSVGQIVGGTFNLTSGSTLNCSAPTGVVVGSTTPPVTFTLPSGSTATVNATIPSITTVTNYAGVLLNGLGTLNFNGDISCGPTSTSNVRVIQITAAGTLNYNGVCTNGGNTANQCNSIFSSAAANVNIITTGFAGGNVAAVANASVYLGAGGNLTITNSGPITGGQSPAVVIIGGNATVVGSVNASANAPAIQNITTATPIIDITGAITAGNGANGVIGLGLIKLNGLLFNTNRFMAVYSPQLTIDSTTTSWRLQTFAGPDIVLYASGAALGQPTANNVRFGTIYGATNEFTGTLRVPNPNTVLLGTLTDATVGSLLMTPAQFVSELNTSTTPVAVRLQNCSTVNTTGDQIASYGV